MSASDVTSYPQLIKALSIEQKIVYLCGAGASMSLAEHRMSWPNWIIKGKDYLSQQEQDDLDKIIGSWSAEELIKAATFLLDKLKASGSYDTFMNSTVGSLHAREDNFIDALRKIWRAGDLISTTNYDLTIEESVNAKAVSYTSPGEILPIIKGDDENKVIHLHGVYDRLNGKDDIVADSHQYADVLSNEGTQFIQNLVSTHPIIIVGCGGTVEDPNLSGFMSFIVEKLRITDVPYFYLMKKGDIVPILPPNAIPVYYGDDYSDLPVFLSEISMVRLRRRAGLRSLVSLNPYISNVPVTSAFGRMHFSNRFNDFVGRKSEIEELKEFIYCGSKFQWWSVIGNGGIGKSRLVFEVLKQMKLSWFGFFSYKHPDEVMKFKPFADTVVVFDYVVGEESKCADTIESYLEVFNESPYKLRVLFIERVQETNDWVKKINRSFESGNRLIFESGKYADPLKLGKLPEEDEIKYVEKYLKTYLPLMDDNTFIRECKSDIIGTGKLIHADFRKSIDGACRRPLYLSIFIEVWLGKEGKLSLSSAEELLDEFLNRERKRWEILFANNEELVDSYMRLLTVACAINQFNITDVYGNNYLSGDCRRVIGFLDKNMNKLGAKNLYAELFVSMSELEEIDENEESIVDAFLNPETPRGLMDEEDTKPMLLLDEDERFAYSTPFLKLNADPEEVYLNLLNNTGVADEEEKEKLKRIHEANVEKSRNLPNHAWIIRPVLPDIIKEYIVGSLVSSFDSERFTKLVRSNSILGLSSFLNLALTDFPSNKVFQKMAITPPDEALNYFEYYISLLTRLDKVENIQVVEKVLIDCIPLFPRYEMTLWQSIVCVLENRGDTNRLYESGSNFLRYLKGITKYTNIRDEAADVIRQYSVSIHNSCREGDFYNYIIQLEEIEPLLPKSSAFGLVLCENYRVFIDMKYGQDKEIETAWEKEQTILERYDYSDEICSVAMQAARDWMKTLSQHQNIDGLRSLRLYLEKLQEQYQKADIIGVVALTAANIYTISYIKHKERPQEEYEALITYLKEYPNLIDVQRAFVIVAKEDYLDRADYRKVPDRIINTAKGWSLKYPDEIEFQEGYFGLLLAKLQYAQAHDMRNEQRRVFREMKTVAERTNYEEYHEENDMMHTIQTLQTIYGY